MNGNTDLACTPTTPCWEVGAHAENVCTYPTPSELKMLLKYFTKILKIRSSKCLFNSKIIK